MLARRSSMHPLLRYLRDGASPDRPAVSLSHGEIAPLVSAAHRHGLAAWVSETAPARVPEAAGLLVPALRDQASAVVAQNLRNRRLLKRTLGALADEGITPVLLKGLGFGARYYPGPHLRPSTDVDVLVAPEQLHKAARALEALGLTKSLDPGVDELGQDSRHLAFHGPDGLVELHFRALHGFGDATLELTDLEGRCIGARFDGLAVRYLGPEDEFVYMAAHAANHLFGRLSWALDLALLRQAHPNFDWSRIEVIVARGGLANAVVLAWCVGQQLFSWEPLPAVPWAARGWRGRALARLLTGGRLIDSVVAEHRMGSFALRAMMADDPGGVATHITLGVTRFVRRRLARNN